MFLNDLIGRTLGVETAVSPRRASRFEMPSEPFETMEVEREPAPSPTRPASVDSEPTEPHAKRTVEPRPEQEVLVRLKQLPPVEPERPAKTAHSLDATGQDHPQTTEATPHIDWAQLPERPVQQREPIVQPIVEKTIEPNTTPHNPPIETVIREVHKIHHDNRTIERMLESLTRETRVEQSVVVERASPASTESTQQPEHRTRREPDRLELVSRQRPPATARPSRLTQVEGPRAEPVVHVTIGRVEVRAAAATPSQPKPRSRQAKPGLDEYLRRREGR